MRFLILAPLALAACTTTPADLREKPPVESFQTSKPRARVAQCIAENLQGIGSPSVIPGETETIVTFHQIGATTIMFTISETGKIDVRRLHGMMPYREVMARCV